MENAQTSSINYDHYRLQLNTIAISEVVRMQFDFKPNFEVVKLIGELDEFKGSWRSLANISPERLAGLKHVATIESIGSSTRIEGALLTDNEVENLLADLTSASFQLRDQQEVRGYAEVMETIFENWSNIPLTENHLKQLHGQLLNHSSKDDRHRGKYKVFPNHVERTDQHGNVSVIFETVSPLETPYKMTDLVAWTSESLEEKTIHPLLVVAAFVVKFLEIHPFQDGNGRLSRVITTLLLLKSGYAYVPYSSMESVIEKNKESYYLALRKTQTSFQKGVNDWDPWVLFFLHSMKKQKDLLQAKIDRELLLQPDIPALGIRVMELLRQHGSLQSSQLLQLTGESKSTIRLRLNELEELGHIVRRGQGRATWYTLKLAPSKLSQPY